MSSEDETQPPSAGNIHDPNMALGYAAHYLLAAGKMTTSPEQANMAMELADRWMQWAITVVELHVQLTGGNDE